MYSYIEYPKALYLNGQCEVVNSKEEEEALNEEGYTDWNSDNNRDSQSQLDLPKKRGPKPKNPVEG